MKEIRIHGRGGMGAVKAVEALVYAAVMDGNYGNSIPFFGFERQGAPVTAFVRISEEPIRPKNRVYHPDIIIVLDPTIMNAVNVFEGVKEGGILVLNTTHDPKDMEIPKNIASGYWWCVMLQRTPLMIGAPYNNSAGRVLPRQTGIRGRGGAKK